MPVGSYGGYGAGQLSDYVFHVSHAVIISFKAGEDKRIPQCNHHVACSCLIVILVVFVRTLRLYQCIRFLSEYGYGIDEYHGYPKIPPYRIRGFA
jgi:hypothetical protein